MNNVLLENHLRILKPWLDQNDISEISINRPGEIWVERRGHIQCHSVPQLSLQHLKDLAQLVATATEQIISAEQPLLSATLPQGQRVQIILPPAVALDTVAVSIRKPSCLDLNLDGYAPANSISMQANELQQISDQQKQLLLLHKENRYQDLLKLAVAQRRNILISGGTSSGKTTFLNALLKQIPADQRIITIEDVPEIHLTQANSLTLFAARNREQNRAKIDTQDLVEASLRLRPDRIIIGELRGSEAFSFLRAVNTGHPGSMATLHADTPQLAVEQLILMVMQKNLGLNREQIEQYIFQVIDIIVQLKKNAQGIRYISEIYFPARI